MSETPYNVIAAESGVPVKAWTKGVPLEDAPRKQLLNAAQLPFIFKWIAAMPDVHWGIGATVGSVIPMRGAIIPAAGHRALRGLRPRGALGAGLCTGQPRADDAQHDRGRSGVGRSPGVRSQCGSRKLPSPGSTTTARTCSSPARAPSVRVKEIWESFPAAWVRVRTLCVARAIRKAS